MAFGMELLEKKARISLGLGSEPSIIDTDFVTGGHLFLKSLVLDSRIVCFLIPFSLNAFVTECPGLTRNCRMLTKVARVLEPRDK